MDIHQHKKEIAFVEKTLFIIVIYKCAITQSASFKSLLNESISGSSILVFDNSPNGQLIPDNLDLVPIYYEHRPDNPGTSSAYNEGSRMARQLKKEWLFLLDQDTQLPQGFLMNYQRKISEHSEIKVFTSLMIDHKGIVSPFYSFLGKGLRKKKLNAGLYSFEQLRVINSGLLISTALFEQVNGYDERFPLDFSDIVFNEKLESISQKFILTDNVMLHSLSSESDDRNNKEEVLNRFELFCQSVQLFRTITIHPFNTIFTLLSRAIKLTFFKKDSRFLIVAIKSFTISK
jgi:GT2 family glycosyltransferase